MFLPEEDRPGAANVALIGHRLWMRRFGGEPSLMGREIMLNSEKYTVVGVMPPGFSYPTKDADIWSPIAFTPDQLAKHGTHYLTWWPGSGQA